MDSENFRGFERVSAVLPEDLYVFRGRLQEDLKPPSGFKEFQRGFTEISGGF